MKHSRCHRQQFGLLGKLLLYVEAVMKRPLSALLFSLVLYGVAFSGDITIHSSQLGECWGVGASTSPANGFEKFYGISGDVYNNAKQDSIMDFLFLNSGSNCGFSNIRHQILCYHTDSTAGKKRWQHTHEPDNDNWNWGADSCQMWFISEAKERHENLFLHTCPWSPPAWMKTNNSEENGGYVREGMEEELAEYFVVFLNKYRNDYGLTFKALSIQNEPNFGPGYQSCKYEPSDFDRVVPVIKAMMIDSGLSDVMLGAPNNGETKESYEMYSEMDSTTKDLLDWIPTNDYSYFVDSTDLTVFGKPVMMTEIQYKNSKMGTQDQVAAKFVKRFNRGENGMNYWRYVKSADSDDSSLREGLIGVNGNGTIIISKMCAYLGVLSRAMQNGNTLLSTTNDLAEVNTCASMSPTGEMRLVVAGYGASNYANQTVAGFNPYDTILVLRSTWDENEKIAELAEKIADEDGTFTADFPAHSITAFMAKSSDSGSVGTISRRQSVRFGSAVDASGHGNSRLYDIRGRALSGTGRTIVKGGKASGVAVQPASGKKILTTK
ncbi:MAG: hypothetical protein GF344_17125 [Chitinivibrionales bacterium]|nr:hypothetical protein [Chitinivibrionales bacterium]MBD3358405.1 hypothetical protein [Chitinivibrionales bacterium]